VSSIRWFRVVALVEGISYLVLLGASVAKRAFDAPEAVTVVGPLHGLLFVAYVALALAVRERLRWSGWTTVVVVVAAAIPLGALVVERRLLSPEAVAAATATTPATPGSEKAAPGTVASG
jgi:integral membrane protein